MQVKFKYTKATETLTVEDPDGDDVIILISDITESTSDYVKFDVTLVPEPDLMDLPEAID